MSEVKRQPSKMPSREATKRARRVLHDEDNETTEKPPSGRRRSSVSPTPTTQRTKSDQSPSYVGHFTTGIDLLKRYQIDIPTSEENNRDSAWKKAYSVLENNLVENNIHFHLILSGNDNKRDWDPRFASIKRFYWLGSSSMAISLRDWMTLSLHFETISSQRDQTRPSVGPPNKTTAQEYR